MLEKTHNKIVLLGESNQTEQSRVKLVLNFNLSQIFSESFGLFIENDFGCGLLT